MVNDLIVDSHKVLFIHIPKTGGCSIEATLSSLAPLEEAILLKKSRDGLNFSINYQHAFPNELERYSLYRSFCFVRNPWDRIVSGFSHHKRFAEIPTALSFDKFVELLCRDKPLPLPTNHPGKLFHLPSCSWVRDQMIVGRFETLQEDYDRICEQLALPVTKLPLINKGNHRNYRTYYTEKTKLLIGTKYEEDIERFKYLF